MPSTHRHVYQSSFAPNSKSKHVCALRTAYLLAPWPNFHILSLKYENYLPHTVFHGCISVDRVLVASMYLLPQRGTKYVSIYLNDYNLKSEVNFGTPGHVLINEMQWFFLVTFKSDIPKNEVRERFD
jgi:hypothetical protein